MIDPTASDCKKVTRYVNTASDIKPPSDKLPSNNPPVKTEPVQKPSLQASTKITVKVKFSYNSSSLLKEGRTCAEET